MAATRSFRDGSMKAIRNPPKLARASASSTACAAPSGRRESACRKSSESCDAACAPRLSWRARIGSDRSRRAPALVAIRDVRSTLPPSTTITSAAPAANAEATAPAIHSSSLSVGMTTVSGTASSRHPFRQLQRDREHAPQHGVARGTFELAHDQLVEALVERARDRLHRHAAVDVRDEHAALAVARDAGAGAVLERDLDE